MPTIGINHFKSIDDGVGTGGVTFADTIINTGLTHSSPRGLYASFAVLLSAGTYGVSSYHSNNKWQESSIDEIVFTHRKIGCNFTPGYRFGGNHQDR